MLHSISTHLSHWTCNCYQTNDFFEKGLRTRKKTRIKQAPKWYISLSVGSIYPSFECAVSVSWTYVTKLLRTQWMGHLTKFLVPLCFMENDLCIQGIFSLRLYRVITWGPSPCEYFIEVGLITVCIVWNVCWIFLCKYSIVRALLGCKGSRIGVSMAQLLF